jgi:hypothetical protein
MIQTKIKVIGENELGFFIIIILPSSCPALPQQMSKIKLIVYLSMKNTSKR